MHVFRLRLRGVCACVVVALAAGATVAADVASAAPPTLDDTRLRGDLTSWSGCALDGRLSFAGAGETEGGAYPGTFTHLASATLSPGSFPIGLDAPLSAFAAQIGIASSTAPVAVVLRLQTPGATEGRCTMSARTQASRITGPFDYAATITAPDGVYRDEGVATVEITARRSTGDDEPDDEGSVRTSFDSALTETVLAGPGGGGPPAPAPAPSPGAPSGAGPGEPAGGTTTGTSTTPTTPSTSTTSPSAPRRARIAPRQLVLKGVAWNSRVNRVNVDVWGGLRLRPGMRRATACASQGKVRFVVTLRGRTVGTGATRVRRDCNFKKVVPALTRGRRLVVKATFEGNRRLAPARRTIRLTALR